MEPRVTVLMALYNGGEYLKQSVQSVLGQAYRNFEFLIINDCSTDNSLETIKSFRDERIRVHHNESNLGQTKSLNIGLEMASGDYIARIDADDVALPQWLEEQVKSIKEHPESSVVSAYALAVDEHNRIKKLYKPPLEEEGMIFRSLIASPINHVGSIFKRKDIIENGGYGEQYKTAADYDLWGKLLRNGYKITTTPKILMAIREHARSLSRSERGKREIEEIMEIAGVNIRKFTNTEFSDGEVQLFCRANYDEDNLTDAEFSEAVEVTKKVYRHLTSSWRIAGGTILPWIRKRCTTIYLKRFFSVVNRKDYCTARRLSFKATKEFGPLSIFTILWAASLTGGIAVNFIPELYNKILRQKARLQLGIGPNKGILN